MHEKMAWRIGVIIPARNEQALIARCINSIRSARSALRNAVPIWIVVVADSCTDSTVALAQIALENDGEVIACEVRSAGAARSLGATAVLKHFKSSMPATIWLANTDADSYVPLDWLKRHLELANEGVAGIAGIVDLDRDVDDTDRVHTLFRETYRVLEDGSHTHVHGANLGVRADAYLAVGGWGSRALAEDHCLWGRLKQSGWPLLSTISSRVTTSARLKGRAAGGFADTLQRHIENAGA